MFPLKTGRPHRPVRARAFGGPSCLVSNRPRPQAAGPTISPAEPTPAQRCCPTSPSSPQALRPACSAEPRAIHSGRCSRPTDCDGPCCSPIGPAPRRNAPGMPKLRAIASAPRASRTPRTTPPKPQRTSQPIAQPCERTDRSPLSGAAPCHAETRPRCRATKRPTPIYARLRRACEPQQRATTRSRRRARAEQSASPTRNPRRVSAQWRPWPRLLGQRRVATRLAATQPAAASRSWTVPSEAQTCR